MISKDVPSYCSQFQSARFVVLTLVTLFMVLLCGRTGAATTIADYSKNIERAIGAFDSLSVTDEQESLAQYDARFRNTLESVRTLLPAKQNIEWAGAHYSVDNSWLHQLVEEFEKATESDRPKLLRRIEERLKALHERVSEVEKSSGGAVSKEEARRKLAGILGRPEYTTKADESSAISRLWQRFLRWLLSFSRMGQPARPGSGQLITQFSQIFVVLLALAVIIYVLKVFTPKLRHRRSVERKLKLRPRVVLGERLEPEQTAAHLLTEAEALARRGEIRAAIRKAYIGLLVELGDRKIISLAQHKTNQDYLRSLRERELLHRKMSSLTDSFERHWYGFAHATDNDWAEFRARYREALQENF